MMLLVVNKSSWHAVGAAIAGIGVTLVQPRSRGTVRLTSRDPGALPDVRFRMLTDPLDFEHMVKGLRLALDLMQDPRVRPLRHELFAVGYSGVVRRLNQPGVVAEAVTPALAAALDGPDILRRAMITMFGSRSSSSHFFMSRGLPLTVMVSSLPVLCGAGRVRCRTSRTGC